jgi:hypothetical protein
MRPIGFSSGALALGDFRRALAMLADLDLPVLELSALRVRELEPLVEALDDLGVERRFAYVAFHAPSRIEVEEEGPVVALLRQVAKRGWPVVVHPGVMWTPALWQPLGDLLCIENMDHRNATGRTCSELATLFETYPAATLCLDLGHARQIDPSMVEAYRKAQQRWRWKSARQRTPCPSTPAGGPRSLGPDSLLRNQVFLIDSGLLSHTPGIR